VTSNERQYDDAEPEVEISTLVGENLRKLRTRQGLSLERLAKASGVSRAMLGQIELGRSAPSINLLWKIARSLNVPISVFVASGVDSDIMIQRAHRAKVVNSANGRFSIRSVTPIDRTNREDLAEVRLSPKSLEEEDAHPAGSTELLVIIRGVLELRVGGSWHCLEKGDSALFNADVPHAYRNPGLDETTFFMMTVNPTLKG